MKTQLSIIGIAVLCFALVVLTIPSCEKEVLPDRTIDSSRVEVIPRIEAKKPSLPNKVVSQIKPDTLLRQKKEKETILLGVELKEKKRFLKKNKTYLAIQTIEKSGEIKQMEHETNTGAKFKIDSNGVVEIEHGKKKKGKGLLIGISVGVGVVVGVLIAK